MIATAIINIEIDQCNMPNDKQDAYLEKLKEWVKHMPECTDQSFQSVTVSRDVRKTKQTFELVITGEFHDPHSD